RRRDFVAGLSRWRSRVNRFQSDAAMTDPPLGYGISHPTAGYEEEGHRGKRLPSPLYFPKRRGRTKIGLAEIPALAFPPRGMERWRRAEAYLMPGWISVRSPALAIRSRCVDGGRVGNSRSGSEAGIPSARRRIRVQRSRSCSASCSTSFA